MATSRYYTPGNQCARAHAAQYAALAMLVAALSLPSFAQRQLQLDSVTVERDTAAAKAENVVLTFTSTPISFPVYAMTDPERVVVDLPDTRAREGIASFEPKSWFVQKVGVTPKVIGGVTNIRIEVFLRENVRYTAYITGKRIVLSLKSIDKVKKEVPVFTATATSASLSSISGIEMRSLEKSFEVDISFTAMPQAASIYMLDDPPRIVMDFNNVFIDKAFEKEIKVPPVKSIAVIKREGEMPYAGVVIGLRKKVAFHYEQVEQRIVVSIPWQGDRLSGRAKFMLVGTGFILAGGFVTGVILSGEQQAKQQPSGASGQDLGSPPQMPPQQ